MTAKRPHIIIFNPDEMRWDGMSHMGNPAAITPNLDALAAREGISFRQAFCQNGVCVPSRCSFFTGLYPHVNGHRTMTHLLHPGEESLFSELKAAGYYVWMNDRNDLHAGQIPGWFESNADEIFSAKPGKRGPQKPAEKLSDIYSHFKGKIEVPEGETYQSGDDAAIEAAIERIENWDKDQPLCMFLGLIYPHCPYQVEEPYYSAIDRSKLPPRVKYDECSGKSQMLGDIRRYSQLYQDYTEEQFDELRAVYLGMCMKIDAQYGQLVEALKKAGMYDDSAIFVLSDHGDFAGDYDCAEKAQSTFEDPLVRVPLLIKPPAGTKLDPGITDSLAELVDFYATAMDFAGVEPQRTQFGRSLRPVIADRSAKVRDFVCTEGGRLPGELHCDEYHVSNPKREFEYWPKMMAQTDDRGHAKGIMIRNDRYKYVNRITDENEFYDLQEDPQEKVNRIDDPALQGEILKMQHQLLNWLQATSDVVPWKTDSRFTFNKLWSMIGGICPPEYKEEARELAKEGGSIATMIAFAMQKRKEKEAREAAQKE